MNYPYKAAILDLDGVITQTARLHAKAWKKMFDQYNHKRGEKGKGQYHAFSLEKDYPKYLDGVPRYDGVRNFLESRNISFEKGTPEDPPHKETICGLGNWKNEIFQDLINKEKPEVYLDTLDKIKEWRTNGIKIAVISSSKNCKKILEAVGIQDLFDVRVDGVVSKEENIKGKPEPDIFLAAAKKLSVSPEESFIIEDAIQGVQAGKNGNFKLVIGVARNTQASKLYNYGADKVVNTLSELQL